MKKAMLFAAGLGTRLKPLTDHCPKALVEIEGRPLLAITLERLIAEGFEQVVVNVHHFAPMIKEYLAEEILKRYYFQKGVIIQQLKDDKELKEAVKILSDEEKYSSMLRPKAVE